MVYESSYESGRKPFTPDKYRGQWASPNDYVFACIGLALKLDLFTNSWFFFFEMGLIGILLYGFSLMLFVIPLMVIQSFLGQFSSSGFISVFRISPLFKSMGYISLALNLSFLTYYSVFAAVPILYLLYSLSPTLPWSCEGYKTWAHKLKETEYLNLCNYTDTVSRSNITIEIDGENVTEEIEDFKSLHVPSDLFFRYHFKHFNYSLEENEISISWMLVLSTLITWSIIAFIFYKFFNTEKIGQYLRYGILIVTTFMVIFIIRFCFLPGATEGLWNFFIPNYSTIGFSLETVPFYGLSALGAGWGSIITLSSFNNFKTDIMRYSWLICTGQLIIFFLFSLMQYLMDSHFTHTADKFYVERMWILYLSSGSILAKLEFANLWCILFFSMLALAGIIVMVLQIFSVLVSVFDEFEMLRERKMEVTLGVIGMMALSSIYFCTNHGILYHSALSMDSLFTQSMLNLLLLLVVLWVYGRERFQRDIEFMLSQRFSTWKVNMARFVAPLFLLITLVSGLFLGAMEHRYSTWVMHLFAAIYIVLPWLVVPGYAFFILVRSTGLWLTRFKRVCRPTDWYPVEMEDRQRYEVSVGNVDITHQLNEVSEEVC